MDQRASRGESGARPKSLRLFFALWPDAAARVRLAAMATDVARAGGGRAVAPDNLHVTIAFVGAVVPQRVEALREAGTQAANGVRAIDVSLEQLGGAHGGDLVWLAPASLPDELIRLHQRLGAALDARAFAVEQRAFRPHVTLARRCVRPVQRAVLDAVAWRIDRLTLMASTTRAGGSEYRELAGWPLAHA